MYSVSFLFPKRNVEIFFQDNFIMLAIDQKKMKLKQKNHANNADEWR